MAKYTSYSIILCITIIKSTSIIDIKSGLIIIHITNQLLELMTVTDIYYVSQLYVG
jgi:hypothetical protein